MFAKASILLALLAPVHILAEGNIQLKNSCTFPIFTDGVQGGNGVSTGDGVTNPGDTTQFDFAPDNVGLSLKMASVDGTVDGSDPNGPNGPFQFEVTVKDGLSYYDFSALDGDPFQDQGRLVTLSDTTCTVISCPAGQVNPSCSPGSYYPGEPSDYNPVYSCSEDATIFVEICAAV